MQEQGNDGTPLEENILRELALIKILIDIKITILSTSESPHFKVIWFFYIDLGIKEGPNPSWIDFPQTSFNNYHIVY